MTRYAFCLLLLFTACDEWYTPDITPPRVVATAPADDAIAVPRNARIRIHFSRAMNESLVERSFVFTQVRGGCVLGEFSWPSSKALVFTPAQLLDSATDYQFSLGLGAKDRAGNSLEQGVFVTFTTGALTSEPRVWMFGRSVLENWFYHWGWTGDSGWPVTRGRATLYHRCLTQPEGDGANTVADLRQQVAELNPADSPVVFVKLCFADFSGGDSVAAAENLARNANLMAQLAARVIDTFGYRLILGNALPKAPAEHDRWLYWNHTRYNAYLDSLAGASAGRALVLDLYSALTDTTTHALQSGYATAPDDAHPNSAACEELDLWLDDVVERF
jgi:hypothetical protein